LYLPPNLEEAKVLVTVKAYPRSSEKYDELVCTAGLLNGEHWIRIYPVPFRFLKNNRRFPKYSWIKLNLVKNTSDFRPESYRPKSGINEDIRVIDKIGTGNGWEIRKQYILNKVFYSMNALLSKAKNIELNKSLATVKPMEIIDFKIKESSLNRKEKVLRLRRQTSIFDIDNSGNVKDRKAVPELPFEYRYQFRTKGDSKTRTAKIEDWEIGALFWNCLKRYNGDEDKANQKVREKYYEEFVNKKDLYFFMGTTKANHIKAENPFIIIGVFYPPLNPQISLPFDK